MTSEIKNKISPKIRKMEVADLHEVFSIESKVFPDPWTQGMFKDHLKDDNWGGFVAESDSVIVGYACYHISDNEGHLTNIAVDPLFQRRKIALKLLKIVLDIVLQRGCEFILLEVRPSNNSAIAFYELNGFKNLYRRPNYYHNPKEDALVMVKYFDDERSN